VPNGKKVVAFGGQACSLNKMNIRNNRGGQAVAETETLPRPHFRNRAFQGTTIEAYCVKPTIGQIINALQTTIDAWDDVVEENAIWDIRCHYEAIRLLQGMKEVA